MPRPPFAALAPALALSLGACGGASPPLTGGEASESSETSEGDTTTPEGEGSGSGSGGFFDFGTPPESPYDDPVEHLAIASGAEVVAVAWDGEGYAATCGGFGANVDDLSDPSAPISAGQAGARCQNLAFGRSTGPGERVLYLAHHGDTWVSKPQLSAYRIGEGDEPIQLSLIGDDARLFEGLAWAGDHLFVTEHQAGLEVYTTAETGEILGPVASVVGLGNAIEISLDADAAYAYVADAEGLIHVLEVAEPASPVWLGSIATLGSPRSLDVDQGQLFVGLGGDGVALYDLADPVEPQLVTQIDLPGSVQAVDADGPYVALANWSHTSIHSAEDLSLLGTERVVFAPDFEQDLGVALAGTMVLVGEWESLHVLDYNPGITAPDAWVDEELFVFDASEPSDRVVLVENRGQEPLVVSDIEVGHEAYSILAALPMVIEPGQKGAFELGYTPPAPRFGYIELRIETDDPDTYQSDYRFVLLAQEVSALDVGDTLTEDYAFLDPEGLAGLEGNVLVLAYFALF